MTDKERNAKLVEKYEKMSYEELGIIEKDPSLSYEEYVIVGIMLALKEEEAGIPGIPFEEAFDMLLGDYQYKENSNKAEGIKRFG